MDSPKKLYVNFLWHMHQPYYKNVSTGKYIMPWVRLHGTKDYLDMPLLLERYPNVKMNFNLVPSLLEQIVDYAQNDAKDDLLLLSEKRAEDLTDAEKIAILSKFFMANPENMIKPYPRYKELSDRRGWAKTKEEFARSLRYFRSDDFRDIQVWFNLVWIDPVIRRGDDFLRGLIEKGGYFSEEEKAQLLMKQRQLLSEIIPVYKRLQEKGQIEISATPFYHPILPILYNTDFARRAHPKSLLPSLPFRHPEDVREQILRAADYHEMLFGKKPRGFWPSEGSVCPELIPIFEESGAKWIATDEEILALSIGKDLFKRSLDGCLADKDAAALYKPYYASFDKSKVAIVFRDHFLSDLIGFQYASWKSDDASIDLIGRLEAIIKQFANKPSPHPPLVSIILDGENCWEHYYLDGLNFLSSLYDKLNSHPDIGAVSIGEYIEKFPPIDTIENLYTGSWIFHDFGIWMGHKEDALSWDYLNETHSRVTSRLNDNKSGLSAEKREEAHKCLLIAEGSDWNWWYGDDHSSGSDEEFDALYREHLMNACRAAGVEIPPRLYIPITSKGETGSLIFPKSYIEPTLDGRDSYYYEWFMAGCYNPTAGGDSMHQVAHYLKKICFGFNKEDFFIRIDPERELLSPTRKDEVEVSIVIFSPYPMEFSLTHPPKENKHHINIIKIGEDGNRTKFGELSSVAVGYLIEMSIPFAILGARANSIIHLQVILRSNGKEIEKCPARDPISVFIPKEDYYSKQWMV